MHRSLSLTALAAVIALALAAPALAADPFEPNDSLGTAYGPLSTTQLYHGEIGTTSDADLFWFELSAPGEVTFTLDGDDGCLNGRLSLSTAGGATVGKLAGDTGDMELVHSFATAGQYAVQVTASLGCTYDLGVDPSALIVERPAGAVAFLDSPGDLDTVQRVLVDGQLAGEATNNQQKWLALGSLTSASRITFEAQNAGGSWGWNAVITSTPTGSRAILFQEKEYRYYSSGTTRFPRPAARIGITRRLVTTAGGTVLESCGEHNAPALCFPIDDDLDGIPNASDQCTMQAGPAAAGGCPDRDGDTVADAHDSCADVAGPVAARGCPDADGDGVGDPLDKCAALAGPPPVGCPPQRNYVTKVSLRHRGKRFTGRVLSAGPGCVAGRVVVLHRAGKRAILGKATARANGAFTIVAPKARRGPFFVSVPGKRETRKLCRTASSRSVR